MQVVSVNVGQPREVLWKGRTVVTGIFKDPVKGRVRVRWENVDGDRQADLFVHGDRDKAVYLYPSEHYPAWRRELADMVLPWGVFGENLTTEGVLEEDARIGDRFCIGLATLVVTQSRIPCFKLRVRVGRDDILQRFLESRRSGFYCAVAVEGEIEARDRIERITGVSDGVTVAEITRRYVEPGGDRSELLRLASLEGLPDSLRNHFANQARRLWLC